MKKLLTLFLTLCLLVTASGCGKSESDEDISSTASLEETSTGDNVESNESVNPAESTTSATQSKSATSSKGANSTSNVPLIKDLKGYTFTIATTLYENEQKVELGVSDYLDAVYLRNKKIEQQYNCKIRYEYYEPQTFYNTAQTSIMAGDKFADIIDSQLFSFGALYMNKYLYNLEKIPNLKLDSSIWIKEYKEKFKFKDGMYGVTTKGLNPAANMSGTAVHYNKTLVANLKLTDPVTHVKNGTWTWDTFRDMMLAARKDLNGDGKYNEKDRLGCTSASYDGLVPFFLSSGVNAVIKDSSKNLQYNMNNAAAATALLKFSSIFTSSDGAFYNTMDYHKQLSLYGNGNALFYIGSIKTPEDEFSRMSFEDAIAPIPLYKAGEKYIAAASHNIKVFSVPKTVKNPENTGLIFQALAEAAEPEYNKYINTEIYPLFRSESSVEMIDKYIVPNLYIDYMMLSKGNSLPVYNATECAIANPIFDTSVKASDLVQGYGPGAQEILAQMFNNR